ncbi:HIT family protein [Lentilactobacillus sp. Marseille-Q4993]|uniref:HIT family protein n=1 Tax=Lentilactobacillus sp. Marseille-Q4993 TaxID=3039492 RepID=UPI0024BC3163|nr:HIT family protein [Lentilactobacillus sp. Marseille-Q4993]
MKQPNCIFCQRTDIPIVLENDLAVAFWDIHPVRKGHLLIVLKDHKQDYFDLDQQDLLAMDSLLREGKQLIDDKYHPEGYNIGINVGEYAGQTVMHCHWHLIPRYKGDVKNPAGGIRNMLPKAARWLRDKR